MEHTLLYLIIAFLLAEFLLARYLDYLNNKNWKSTLPGELNDLYDEDKYATSQQYDRDKQRMSVIAGSISLAAMITILMLGGFAWLDGLVQGWTGHNIFQALSFFGIIYIAADLMGIPFSLYGTFVIEEKYGFNKMSVATYIKDKLKGYLLGAIIGGALLAVFVWFYQIAGELFWLYAWGVFLAFAMFMNMFYTSLIVPLFNKLSPLEPGELREAIEAYSEKVKFKLKNIYVMDGSKRSSKANAYFSGIGPKKSIVLFDTLIEKNSVGELVSVLAHEVGHYKKKHIILSYFISAVTTFIMLFILGWLIDNPALSGALGADAVSFQLGLVAFGLLYTPISTITSILMNIISRKNEFQADGYAKETSSGNDLQSALKKLSVDHLSNLQPHPSYVFFYYSHPPLLQRLQALKKE